jgi:hypothetical protein
MAFLDLLRQPDAACVKDYQQNIGSAWSMKGPRFANVHSIS